jgi:AraC-like DNA-binding protein/mannose-6-phosphate isomerase-like protein (cupin superfamily)
MILLSIPMTNSRHPGKSLTALARRAARLPAPRDYYAGRRRPALDLPDNLLLFCRHSAAELHDGSLQPHFHHRWVLIVVLRGAGIVHLDGRGHALRPGMTLLVPPLRLHRYRRVTGGKIVWLFVTFDLPGRDKRAATPELGQLNPAARALTQELLAQWQHEAAGGAQLATTTALLLLTLRRQRSVRQPASSGLLERVNRWLADHRPEPVVLANLAADLGISTSHLRAVFREEHGLSLGRYVRETRCRQAAVLLKAGQLTVTEAAAELGFQSVYAFSRTFKRVLGQPPSSLRK